MATNVYGTEDWPCWNLTSICQIQNNFQCCTISAILHTIRCTQNCVMLLLMIDHASFGTKSGHERENRASNFSIYTCMGKFSSSFKSTKLLYKNMSGDLPTQKKKSFQPRWTPLFSFPLNIVSALIETGMPRNCSSLKTHRLGYMKVDTRIERNHQWIIIWQNLVCS